MNENVVDHILFSGFGGKWIVHYDMPLASSRVCQSKAVLDLKQRRQADAETTAAHLAWTQDLM